MYTRHFKRDAPGCGNQLSANAGANLRELMKRVDHESTRAALMYLHSSAERQRTRADAFWHADGTGSGALEACEPPPRPQQRLPQRVVGVVR